MQRKTPDYTEAERERKNKSDARREKKQPETSWALDGQTEFLTIFQAQVPVPQGLAHPIAPKKVTSSLELALLLSNYNQNDVSHQIGGAQQIMVEQLCFSKAEGPEALPTRPDHGTPRDPGVVGSTV